MIAYPGSQGWEVGSRRAAEVPLRFGVTKW